MRVGDFVRFPFVVLWGLVKTLILPALIVAASWWLLGTDSRIFTGIAIGCGAWAVIALSLFLGHVRERAYDLKFGIGRWWR